MIPLSVPGSLRKLPAEIEGTDMESFLWLMSKMKTQDWVEVSVQVKLVPWGPKYLMFSY